MSDDIEAIRQGFTEPAPTISELMVENMRLRAALTEAEKAALIGDAPHVAVICCRALKDKP